MQSHKLPISVFEKYDPVAAEHIAYLNSLHIISVGVVPYPRIVPSLFLDTHEIYSALAPTDIDVLRPQISVHTLAEHKPKDAARVRSNAYLVGNYFFKRFIESRRHTPTLLFSNASESLITKAQECGYKFIATAHDVNERVKTKRTFRELLASLSLPHIPHKIHATEVLIGLSYNDFSRTNFTEAVIQRAEKEVGGNEGTFFVHSEEDFAYFKQRIANEPETDFIVSPYITGESLSMIGCITTQGVLTGPLQLQFIDVPESLHGVPANGTFYGNDWGYTCWDPATATQAQHVVEAIGEILKTDGFVGIFGIDFIFDTNSKELFPLECNPRITGAMPAHSLMLADMGLPPFEYYHLLALTGRDTTFDFDAANEALKKTGGYSHISFSPLGIEKMNLPLIAGVYAFDAEQNTLQYKRPGFHFIDIVAPDEFLIIDAVPQLDEPVPQQVPGFFKFMFKKQIAQGTNAVSTYSSELLSMFSKAILSGKRIR